jgi:UDP-N-acetylglucosamine--N-acetylmuramyl-(pentapeptide) pyrophosphoryl-undecaprenol N-acetylglucosamine transferase
MAKEARGSADVADSLRIAIAAGGTAGHVNPALALAEELTDRGHDVQFFGQPTRLEATLVPEAGYPFFPIEVTGFDRSRPWTALTALAHMNTAEHSVEGFFSREGTPDVAVGFGAYVEMALLRWCSAHGVPYVLHEQNSVPGLANKLCAKRAHTLCLSFPAAKRAFEDHVGPHTKVILTGNPVRQSVVSATRAAGRVQLGVPQDAQVLLVFGGSLGAQHLNQGVTALKQKLLARDGLYVIHSTGARDFEATRDALGLSDAEAMRWRLMAYIQDMGDALAACDLVLSRAGASSIAEIAALAVPSVLVPYPYATENHQYTNAHFLADAGAAVICDDSAIGSAEFENDVLGLLDDSTRRASMRMAARTLGGANAAAALADAVESVGRR